MHAADLDTLTVAQSRAYGSPDPAAGGEAATEEKDLENFLVVTSNRTEVSSAVIQKQLGTS